MSLFSKLSTEVRQYLVVTGNYWAFTLTDGALRMLVVLHFHQLGFSPIKIAMLFLFYELFGVFTNLIGGWLGARLGLNTTMNLGLAIQIIALSMLLVPTSMLTVAWVMIAQALSGIAKDLNKMSAKSAIKIIIGPNAEGALFKWVAILTGSKNTFKGVGFFMGGFLLTTIGFKNAILVMTIALIIVWLSSLVLLKNSLGKSPSKPKFSEVFSKSTPVNTLSAARLFLFGARDVWFVIAVPVYLSQTLAWSHWSVGAFFAAWIIAYGIVQSVAPKLVRATTIGTVEEGLPSGLQAVAWATALAVITAVITAGFYGGAQSSALLIGGLMVFGFVFAINSSLHSYLIVSYAAADNVSMDVGFYYMANAVGRLVGTVLSGVLFQQYGLPVCLLVSTIFLVVTSLISLKLPRSKPWCEAL